MPCRAVPYRVVSRPQSHLYFRVFLFQSLFRAWGPRTDTRCGTTRSPDRSVYRFFFDYVFVFVVKSRKMGVKERFSRRVESDKPFRRLEWLTWLDLKRERCFRKPSEGIVASWLGSRVL